MEDNSFEKRQFKSLSPSQQCLESESIVYFQIGAGKKNEMIEKKRKQRKSEVRLKAYRESSEPGRSRGLVLVSLVRTQEPSSPNERKMADGEGSANVTPKKEVEELPQSYRLCQICNVIVDDEVEDGRHTGLKLHKQTKQYYGLTGTQNDIIVIKGSKEEISQGRFQSIRKRCAKIKQKIQ